MVELALVVQVVESGVEGQAGAHPQEHLGAELVAGGPELISVQT